MAEEKTTNTTHEKAPAAPAKKQRHFEVLSTIDLGRQADEKEKKILYAGDSVSEKDLHDRGVTPEDVAYLIAKGNIADPDAPLAPSQAEGYAALDHLADVAQKIGALKRRGSDYRLAGETYKGVTDFRARVTIEQLKSAIVEKAKS